MPRSDGCITCKLRRKKCDERKPTCVACARNVLICAWGPEPRSREPRRAISHEKPPRPRNVSPSSQGNGDSWAPVLRATPNVLHPQLARKETNFLYSFFHDQAAQAVSIQAEESNPFIHVLMPMAAVNDAIFQAMVAFSGVVYQQRHSAAIAYATWEHYSQAVRSLKHGLTRFASNQMELGPELLATVLLLCSLEISNADTRGNAFHHMKASRELIPAAFAHCRDVRVLGFLAEFYLYTLALLPSSSTYLDGNIVKDTEVVFRALTNSPVVPTGVLCGCASDLFRIIPEATAVSRRLYDEFRSDGAPSQQTLFARSRLHNFVRCWTPDRADDDSVMSARAYQLALLALLTMAELRTPPNPETRNLGANLISLLRSLPVQSNTVTVLAWPLVTVAPFVDSCDDQDFILQYLDSISRKYGLGNHRQTIKLLQLIWSRQDVRDTGPYYLLRAMEAQGYYFMFC